MALVACFERRRTIWKDALPDVLGSAFYDDAVMSGLWLDYIGGATFLHSPPVSFAAIGKRVREFLAPIRLYAVTGEPFDLMWIAGGPWR